MDILNFNPNQDMLHLCSWISWFIHILPLNLIVQMFKTSFWIEDICHVLPYFQLCSRKVFCLLQNQSLPAKKIISEWLTAGLSFCHIWVLIGLRFEWTFMFCHVFKLFSQGRFSPVFSKCDQLIKYKCQLVFNKL